MLECLDGGPRVLYKTHLPINRTRGKCGQQGAVYSPEFTELDFL